MAETVVRVTPEQLGINVGSSYDRQLDYDLGNLAAFDATPVDAAALRDDRDAACLDIATRMTQSLMAQIFSLPKTDDPRVVELPAATTKLPRGKAVPKPKPLSKWAKFAQDKGLTRTTKRSSMIWDENSQDWKRRHGYERGNDPSAVPIIEASHKDLPGEDPFTRLDREKAERIGRNKRNEAGNLLDAQKAGSLPSTIKLTTKLDANSARGQIAKGKALSGDLKNASYLAGVSTASMGKFDKRLRGEKEGERILPGKRAKHTPLTDGAGEKEASGKVLGKLMRRADEPLLNTEKAAKKLQGSKGDDDVDEDTRRKKGRHGRVKNRRVPKKDKRLAAAAGKRATSGGKAGGKKKR